MAELIEIKKVLIGPDNMTAFVRVADDAPLLTSEDVEGTARVYHLLPQIVDHACYGDAGETFRDAIGDTEITHLLEHVTVELLAQTDLAGDMPTGRTWVDEVDERTFEIDLTCPDDVLVAAALSCGVWILDWAYSGGGDPQPNVEAIVAGLVNLVEGVGDQGEDLVIDYGPLEDEDVISADDLAAEGDVDAELEGYTQDLARTAEERPLWTPAPEVAAIMHRTEEKREEEAEPEVEAEIDEIMATIETPALKLDASGALEPVVEDAPEEEEPEAEEAPEVIAEEVADDSEDAPEAEAVENAPVVEGGPTEADAPADDTPKEPAGEFPQKLADAVAAETSRARAVAAAEEAVAAVAQDPVGTSSDIRVIAPAVVVMRTNAEVAGEEPTETPAEEPETPEATEPAPQAEEAPEEAAPATEAAAEPAPQDDIFAPATVVSSTNVEVTEQEAPEATAEDAVETRQEPDA